DLRYLCGDSDFSDVDLSVLDGDSVWRQPGARCSVVHGYRQCRPGASHAAVAGADPPFLGKTAARRDLAAARTDGGAVAFSQYRGGTPACGAGRAAPDPQPAG